ncbi:uncharacterized protein LOC105781685 [Gossypium raimondii]|uniref:uncharacterized protein LOC105781685 n=1 Tax=Gossypium raimondii TaxID=29730 RepID=UPI00063AC1D8|nr:uncharacterized protein LOC105781685 [Gossypium raimondii]
MNVELYSRDLETFRVQEYIDRHSGLPLRSYTVDLQSSQCEYWLFQTLQYPCAYVHASCVRSNLNVDQFIDEIYMLQRTLHIWGNKFPVITDVSNWEVPLPAFQIVPNHSLRRHPTVRPQSTRIRNDMDVREMGEPKLCIVCKASGHNRSTDPHRVYISG